jgi:hypothetical protein
MERKNNTEYATIELWDTEYLGLAIFYLFIGLVLFVISIYANSTFYSLGAMLALGLFGFSLGCFGLSLGCYIFDIEKIKVKKSCRNCKLFGEEDYWDASQKKETHRLLCHIKDGDWGTRIEGIEPCKFWEPNKRLLREKRK